MHTWFKNTLTLLTAILFLIIFWSSSAMRSSIEMPFDLNEREITESDTPEVEDVELPYPHKDKSNEGDPLYDNNNSGIFLKDPANIKTEVTYNPVTGNYDITQKIGDLNYRPTIYMTLEEYKRYDMEQSMKKYYKSKSDAENFNKSKPLIPKLNVGGEMFDRIFGGNTVDIRPQGSAELIFAVNTARNSNPAIPQKQRKVSTFDFNQKIQLNVIGKIGDKLKLTTSYNTEATFDFENQMKLEYTGYDDEIIQKIEAGNVSLPLTGSLITGSQSLFGIKTALKFGKLNATTVFSQSKGQKKEVTIPPGGGQLNYFTINGDNYEANKHYFLSQYFRDHYDKALANLPFVNSGVNITRVEVWVTNRTYDINNRNIAGFMDVGEINPFNSGFIQQTTDNSAPDNKANTLYSKITSTANTDARDFNKITSSTGFGKYASTYNFTLGKDYDITVAKKMQPSDFTYNAKLGYISINQPLNNDEVLAVAFQYTLDGKTYQVGEFSTDGVDAPKVLYLKLLKASLTNVRLPTWDLMMKNVYALGAFQIQKEDFKLDIVHNDIKKGIDFNYLPEGTGVKATPIVRVLGLDKLNRNLDPQPDGIFDIVEGVTINLEKGRIFFPSVEPFGSYLQHKFPAEEQDIAQKYIFQALYDSTKFAAQQLPALNRYKIKGSYKSSSGSDISLNALNIPQGSVTVTSGGVLLTENVDYTVDYSLGRVKIINDGILNSGNAIKASYESNSMFSIQQKSLIGTHLDYKVNKDFALGATAIHVNERPLTQKVNLGDEPISNTIWGLDGNYRTEIPWLTKAIDFLPMISTKEKSTLSVTGEFAQLVPGHSKAVTKEGQSYIDDFEGSQSTIDIKNQSSWVIASIPRGQPDLFPEASREGLASGYHRSKFGWYVIDPLFWRDNNLTPTHIKGTNQQSNNFVREIREQEIFPNRSLQAGQQLTNLPVLDLSFYPKEKGPYNYNATEIDADGKLTNTNASWGGMMRRLETTDFENSNIQYVQFWMMDPFNADYDSAFHTTKPTRGELYINLGDVSEDILPDNRMSFENGLPTTSTVVNVDTTVWGRVPTGQVVVNAFDNNTTSREFQDIGLDGLKSDDEDDFFADYMTGIKSLHGNTSNAYLKAQADASNDNYHFFRGDDYDNAKLDILERYKFYNNMEGNSAVASDPYPTQSTTLPNVEDINKDNTLNRNEAYYQYKIKLDPNNMAVGQNYITNKVSGSGTLKNGQPITCDWYQFKVPVRMPDRVVGNIQDYRSLRFIRIFMKGFDKPVVCRMAKLEFLRGEWRAYSNTKFQSGEYVSNDNFGETPFNIGAVNYEEHSSRQPINYVIPPGIRRQQQANSPTIVQLNEQALSLSVCNLEDGDERAAFKSTEFDMRLYKKLKMFVHAENKSEVELKKGDLVGYIRLGTDFDQNYYEYEYPLKATAWGATEDTDIWPEENNVEIKFADLQDAKLARNNKYNDPSGSSNQNPYIIKTTADQNGVSVTRKITVVGNPNLAAVKVIMVGIRNPKKTNLADADDGLPKCAEVWVNELRLTDFDDKGGWAALTRTQVKLADLGMLTAAGNVSTPGFGTVDQKLNERQKEQILKYDLAGSFEMGKFLPLNWHIKIPMYLGWSQQFITPRFNPLEPDIEYKKSLNAIQNDSTREKVRDRTLDVTNRKSINFTNVKKEKGAKGGKNHIYDVENLAFTYAFTESFHHDYNVEYNTMKTYKGGINYSFSSSPKNFKPFSKVIKSKSEYFKIVKDFNFTLLPNRLGARADLDRQYTETQNRDNTGEGQIIIPTYNKSFTMLRSYDYGHDLAKAINFTFNASNNSRIDEPGGRYHKLTNKERDTLSAAQIITSDSVYNKYNDSLWQNFKKTMGRTTNYHQTASLNYNIPINKIPMFNWVTASAKYTSNFDWNVAPLGLDSIGNTIQNSNTKQYNTTLNTVTLFNKIPYFKKITSPPKPVPKQSEITKKIATYNDSIKKLDKGITAHEKAIAKLKKKKNTEEVKLTQDSIKSKNKTIKLLNHRIDSLNAELEKNKPNILLSTLTKGILSVKNISGSYSENNGTLLPGYLPRTQFFGQSPNWESPGAGFVFGQQDTNFARHAGEKGWLTKSTALNNAFAMTKSKSTNLRATLEPLKDLKVDLTATKSEAFNKSEFYRWNNEIDTFSVQSPISTGNYSVSFISIKTAFKKDKPSDDVNPYESEVFMKFLNSRADFSKRIGSNNPNSTLNDSSFYSGYGATSQDVLIPAFLAAYSGKSPITASTSAFPAIPLPNWRVTYDGLTKLAKFKKYFKNFSLTHGYRSTYNVGSYTSNLLYYEDGKGNPTAYDQNHNYQPKNIISTISISEQFAPLIGADATWNNSLITKFELKRDRNLNMNFANIQLTEVRGNEVSVGTGYRFKNVTIPITVGGKKTILKSDLDLRSDVSFRRSKTIIRKASDESNQLTAGQNVITIKNSANYVVNERLNVRLFYDRVINNPYVSTSFKTSNTNAGVSIRFTLAN